MTATAWELQQRGPGRTYNLPKEQIIRFDDAQPIIEAIQTQLKSFIQLDTSVRLVLDSEYCAPAQAIISVPFEGESDAIYANLANIIYQQMWGYYLSANPKTTHHGLTNLVFEGNVTSLVRREAEKFLSVLSSRHDIMARVMRNYHMACDMAPFTRDVYMKATTSNFLNIHLGVHMFTHGFGVQRINVFMPIEGGGEAIDRIYYNLEHIIHQNFVSYDENHQHYLPVSEELITREVESLLKRATQKQNTRMKLINGLKMHTVLLEDPSQIHHASLADLYYDKINRVDLLEEAGQRSRDMFASALIRSTEITSAAINIEGLKLEQQVYLDRPSAAAQPTQKAAAPQQERVAVSVHKDGLSEL